MEVFIKNFNNRAEFNYSVHISEEFRYIYFNNPKCACTTIKASLNLSCAAALRRQLEYANIGDIHNRSRNLLVTPAEIGYSRFMELLRDTSFFKFCFIREPVHRIVSAYASKLSWTSESLIALNRRLGRPDSVGLDFKEFIEILSLDHDIRDMDEHWRLQRKQVCFDLVSFDKIGLFEHLTEDLQAVLVRVYGPGTKREIFDVRQYFHGNISNAATLFQTLTTDLIGTIRKTYRDDLDLYAIARNVGETARDSSVAAGPSV